MSGHDEVSLLRSLAASAATEGEAQAGPAGSRRRSNTHAAIFAMALLALPAGLYLRSLGVERTIVGLRAEGQPLSNIPFAAVESGLADAAERFLDGRLVLAHPEGEVIARRRDLGFAADTRPLLEQARRAGKSGNPLTDLPARLRARRGTLDLKLPVEIDRAKAFEFLTELKDDVDRAAVDAHLDLEAHTIAAERPGYLLRVYDSLVALEYAARAGAARVELVGAVAEARVRAADLKDIDIHTVLGTWETRYSALAVDSDRTYNLKVGADKLNGHILTPHEVFSFNEVVGDRTEKQGYRVAPVIQGGELIDGLAGGMCQIASTLHAASFFAGLDIISSTPHSRPSAYIPMGLDSTVVYPTVDLKLRNPYDFPVVMHYSVHQGSVRVELLGKQRPYRVVFEREIKQETPFQSETRADPEAPEGQRILLQEGYPGYRLLRRRYIFARDKMPRWSGPKPLAEILEHQRSKPLRKEQWALHYPSTTQFVAIGSSAGKKPKPPPPSHHIPPIGAKDKPIFKLMH